MDEKKAYSTNNPPPPPPPRPAPTVNRNTYVYMTPTNTKEFTGSMGAMVILLLLFFPLAILYYISKKRTVRRFGRCATELRGMSMQCHGCGAIVR